MKILVADDDAISRETVGGLVSKWGYEPIFASDGAEALRILDGQDAPMLGVVDWLMPHMDGVEVCRAIRRNRTYPTLT